MLLDVMAIVTTAIISALVSSVLTGFGTYTKTSNRLVKIETLIAQLSNRVDKHNNVIERMTRIELGDKAQWVKIDVLKERLTKVEDELEKVSEDD